MLTSTFDYNLPPELIAQTPLEPRDSSRLMVIDRASGTISHRHFRDIGDYLRSGDMLTANNSRVIPARMFGQKETGGKVELLLLRQLDDNDWLALVGGKRIGVGTTITLFDQSSAATTITADVIEQRDGAQRVLRFNRDVAAHFEALGHTPLPPYIRTPLESAERYQTVYARPAGSAAAPTAGLHFTPDLLLALREHGVGFETVTLHVGLDTFKPVGVETVAEHKIHREWIELTPQSAERINNTKLAGGRLIAVGTTAVRTLETAAWRSAGVIGSLREVSAQAADACPWKPVAATVGDTDLFIYPGYQYRAVDALITNFHLPKSSLLMLVAAFAGLELMQTAYQIAIDEQYRFYSFGDAMLIL